MKREPHPMLTWLLEQMPSHSLERSFVLASSPMAAAALRRAVTQERGALLAVDFVTVVGLSRKLLELLGEPANEDVADPLEEQELLRRSLETDDVGRHAGRHDSGLRQLLRNLRELGCQGPLPAPKRGDLSPLGQQVLGLARRHAQVMAGRGGRIQWMQACLRQLESGEEGWEDLPARVLVVGFPHLEGDLQLLLEALSTRGVEVLHPPTAECVNEEAPTWHSCPTPYEELRLAAQLCMQTAAEEGIPWHEMVVAAPTLRPYLPHLERAFAAEAVPLHTAAQLPLCRHPRPALCVHLARLLFGRVQRESCLALASSPHVLGALTPELQAELDSESRLIGLRGQPSDARRALASLELPKAEEFLDPILQRAEELPELLPHAERCRLLSEFWEKIAHQAEEGESEVEEALLSCLSALAKSTQKPASGQHFVSELEALLQDRGTPLPGQHQGGVNVVEYHEALAHPATYLHLLGLSADMVPGPKLPETYLADADRTALGLRPAEKLRTEEEERLRLLLRHAPSLALSYARRGADGRPQQASPWIERVRERIQLPQEPSQVAGHPLNRAASRVAAGSCPRDRARDHLALSGVEDAEAFAAVAGSPVKDLPLRVQLLEDFYLQDFSREGDVGREWGKKLHERCVSVSQMNTLGSCPLQYLFQRGMRIKTLQTESAPWELPPQLAGIMVHEVLEKLHKQFVGPLESARDPSELEEAMQEATAKLLRVQLSKAAPALEAELPGIFALLLRRWKEPLDLAVHWDLYWMHDEKSRPLKAESDASEVLQITSTGEPPDEPPDRAEPTTLDLKVRGRLDRVDKLEDGRLRVVDFKTGKAETSVDAKMIFKGKNLQLVLYAMLLAQKEGQPPAEVEVRSVRPGVVAGEDGGELRMTLAKAADYLCPGTDYFDGLQETLAVLLRLRRRGAFPANADHHCSYCDFDLACHRRSPPRMQRSEFWEEQEVLDYCNLRHKNTRRTRLSEIPIEEVGE